MLRYLDTLLGVRGASEGMNHIDPPSRKFYFCSSLERRLAKAKSEDKKPR